MSDKDFFYWIDYQGRGVGIMWFGSRAEAIADAESTDRKHLPAELVRVPKQAVERSGITYDYRGDTGAMEWRK